MIHWTYSNLEPNSDLEQGDILKRSDELLALLRKVHSHFCDDKYVNFVVLTQTCDLVRRKSHCNAKHITLSVVRELDHVLPELLREVSADERIFVQGKKIAAKQFVERLINQNEQAKGLFYLHPDSDAGIATPSIAFLRVSIALRQDHYNVLKSSRVGRLAPEFSSKLGWLSGNLFSRIATTDWPEKDARTGLALIDKYVDHVVPADRWVPDIWLTRAKNDGFDISSLNVQNAHVELKKFAPDSPETTLHEELLRAAYKCCVRRDIDVIFENVFSDALACFFTDNPKYDVARLRDEIRASSDITQILRAQLQKNLQNVTALSPTISEAFKPAPPLQKMLHALFASLGVIPEDAPPLISEFESAIFSKPVVDKANSELSKVLSDDFRELLNQTADQFVSNSKVKSVLKR